MVHHLLNMATGLQFQLITFHPYTDDELNISIYYRYILLHRHISFRIEQMN